MKYVLVRGGLYIWRPSRGSEVQSLAKYSRMLILDPELALSEDKTKLYKLCRKLRPLRDIRSCVRCSKQAIAEALKEPMEFMIMLTLMEIYQRLVYIQKCTTTYCWSLTGQLIMRSNVGPWECPTGRKVKLGRKK